MNTHNTSIEPLEARIAPAAVITYTDGDGDLVKITASTGPLDLGDLTLSNGATGQLQKLDLTAAAFRGASITFAVTRGVTGDGLAHVGRIDATGVDLGNVTIKGDLGVIDAGDTNTKTTALKTLSALSMGRYGLGTQGDAGDLASNLAGRLDALKVAGDLKDVIIAVSGDEAGTLGSVRVGGSLIDESQSGIAGISSSGNMGSVVFRGSVAGKIASGDRLGTVVIGGSLAGEISSVGDMGALEVGQDMHGFVTAGERLAGATIHGSIRGGSIKSGTSMGVIKVDQEVLGDEGDFSDGLIVAGANLAGVIIGGSLIDVGSRHSESIESGTNGSGDIGFVRIGQNLGDSSSGARICAAGKFGSVTVGGSMINGEITSFGNMGFVKIGHDVDGGSIFGDKLAGIKIGGSLIGGDIDSGSDMGFVTIGGDVRSSGGDPTAESGAISAGANLAGVRIGGSLIGGGGGTGGISTGVDMGPIFVGKDVIGGDDGESGAIFAGGKLASVTIGGSLIGGVDLNGANGVGGGIFSFLNMGFVKIDGDLKAPITGADGLTANAGFYITSYGSIASISVRGSIVAGGATFNSQIAAFKNIGSITVGGSIVGNETSRVHISARGGFTQSLDSDLAIGKISVGGRVESADILAGYDEVFFEATPNGDAQIGAVSVGGNWVASNLVAGAKNLGADDLAGGTGANGDNVNYGDSHDASIGAGAANSLAKIASITIGGQIFGTPTSASATDHFGFVAERIGSLRVDGKTIVLSLVAHNDNFAIGPTNDVAIHEV